MSLERGRSSRDRPFSRPSSAAEEGAAARAPRRSILPGSAGIEGKRSPGIPSGRRSTGTKCGRPCTILDTTYAHLRVGSSNRRPSYSNSSAPSTDVSPLLRRVREPCRDAHARRCNGFRGTGVGTGDRRGARADDAARTRDRHSPRRRLNSTERIRYLTIHCRTRTSRWISLSTKTKSPFGARFDGG
jgi:hypothetical protein